MGGAHGLETGTLVMGGIGVRLAVRNVCVTLNLFIHDEATDPKL